MEKRRIIAYVDGFNFYFRRLRNKPYRWLDLERFFTGLFPNDEILKIRYFTARVGGKFDPHKPIRQQAYLKALSTLPKVEIVYGNYLTTEGRFRLVSAITDHTGKIHESVTAWRQEEKGSDVNLGVHLLNDAWLDAFDMAAVLTNDTDLVEAVRLVETRGKPITLVHPDSNPARSLAEAASHRLHIHDKHLREAQFPDEIKFLNGKTIKKPDSF